MISCYAPTRLARREDKDQFYDKFDTIISSIPTNDKYVLLGDLNAHVGSREHNGERWDGVRGQAGARSSLRGGKRGKKRGEEKGEERMKNSLSQSCIL